MYPIQNTPSSDLPKLADCQMACFPGSFSTKLGKQYVQKTLAWFLENENRFLFHVRSENNVIGFCGGFTPSKPGDGSSSGMLQFAFSEALKGLIKNPFLLFHKELRSHYPFIWLNIKRKMTGKIKPIDKSSDAKTFKPYVGLVVIGVLPSQQGKGIAQLLMREFEKRAIKMHQNEIVLSVKKENSNAIKAYEKFGLKIKEELGETFVMNKYITA